MAESEQPLKRRCGAQSAHTAALEHDKTYRGNRRQIESYNKAYGRLAGRVGGRQGIAVIPVVVHILYNNPVDNISDEQVLSQMAALNRDFRKLNADVANVPAVWQNLAVDSAIEFQLAVRDPNGNATTGITRTAVNAEVLVTDLENGSQSAMGEPLKFTESGGQSAWNRDKYLNIWVCRFRDLEQGALLGYAQFPGGNAATDGIVIRTTAFGTIGSAAAPYNLGRTATHEIGHWLDLYHIWGDDLGGCDGDDFVADTPNQAGPNGDKPVYPSITCNNGPHGDMFMNYMDYTDDDSMFMFTKGQLARMDAALLGTRSALLSSDGLTLPVLPVAMNGVAGIAADIMGARVVMGAEAATEERMIRLKPNPVP